MKVFCILVVAIAVSAALAQPAVSSKRLNFAYTYGNPDYVDLSSVKPNVFPAGIDQPDVKARNLKSFAINFRGWRLLDEYIVDPEFFWELDPISLKGKIRTVNYDKISKYPSLAKRYKAIKPTGVNYIVCANLYSAVEFTVSTLATHHVCFRAQSYQMFWGASRFGRAATYPGALLGWREGVSTAPIATRFTAADNSDVNRLKALVSRFSSISSSSTTGFPTNTWLDIRWPDDAIDKIYDDFEEYEKEGKDLDKEYKEAKQEPKVAKRAQPLASDDEMAKPFEDLPKTAKPFLDRGAVVTVGLISPKGRKVFSSDLHNQGIPLEEKSSVFTFGLRDYNVSNRIHLVNAAGKKMKIDGHEAVMEIKKSSDGSTYTVFVDNGGPEVYRTVKCYEDGGGPYSTEEFTALQSRDRTPLKPLPPGNPNAVYFGFSQYHYVYKTVIRYIVDSKLRVLNRSQGYAVARNEPRSPERCS